MKPGLQVRLSQSGLQYAADVATTILSDQIGSLQIDDQEGSERVPVGKIEYKISTIRVESYAMPKSTVSTDPLAWAINGARVVLTANWRYKTKGVIKFRDDGSLRTKLGLDLMTVLSLGVDDAGRPTIRTEACNAVATQADVKFNGGASWLYNLFNGHIEKVMRHNLERNVRRKIEHLINEKARKSLADTSLEVDLRDDVILDNRLLSAPVCTSAHVDFLLKGQFRARNESLAYPDSPADFLQSHLDSKMVVFWLSKYSIDTLIFTKYHQGKLGFTLRKTDLPDDKQGLLNTTSDNETMPCFGSIIPQIGQLRPNDSMELRVAVVEMPTVEMNEDGIKLHLKAVIKYYAVTDTEPPTESFLFSTHANVSFKIWLALDGLKVTYSVSDFDFQTTHSLSNIGPIDKTILQQVITIAVHLFVIPKLNKRGKVGSTLPSIKDVEYINPKLSFNKDVLSLAVDLHYIEK